MNIRNQLPTVSPTVGTALMACMLAATPAGAINNKEQVLIGGNSLNQNVTSYTAPGLANQYGEDFPGTGLGSMAAEVRMPDDGTLRNLRVRLTTQNVPLSGSFSLTVVINGTDTALTCTLTVTGSCTSNAQVPINKNNRLLVRVENTFTGAGFMTYTYALLLD